MPDTSSAAVSKRVPLARAHCRIGLRAAVAVRSIRQSASQWAKTGRQPHDPLVKTGARPADTGADGTRTQAPSRWTIVPANRRRAAGKGRRGSSDRAAEVFAPILHPRVHALLAGLRGHRRDGGAGLLGARGWDSRYWISLRVVPQLPHPPSG